MKDRIGRRLSQLHQRYPRGLYRGLAFPLLTLVYKRLTVYWYFRRLVRWLMRLDDQEKMPPFAAELYQSVWVLIGIVLLVVVPPSGGAAFVAMVRVYDILIFLLYWTFVSDEFLHSYQRALWSFMINLVETVVLFAVTFRAFGCLASTDSTWKGIYDSLRTVVTIGPSASFTEKSYCTILVAAEIALAYLLTVIVVAHLAGRIFRTEKNQ